MRDPLLHVRCVAMVPYHSPLGGMFVARCPECGDVCAYWDDDDLDENGDLLCYHDEEES